MATTPILQLPFPTEDDTVDPPRDFEALAMAIDPLGTVPVGAFMLWLTAIAPNGWLLMQGQAVPAAQYPGLAALLGQAGGNVTIPDMRERFPTGAGATTALGVIGGASAVALTARQSGVRAHQHGGTTGAADRSLAHDHAMNPLSVIADQGAASGFLAAAGTRWAWTNAAALVGVNSSPDHLHAIPWEPDSNALDAHENRPPFRAVNFIIRAG
jgi:microcystin-dependent protein